MSCGTPTTQRRQKSRTTRRPLHPERDTSGWKWKGTLATIYLTCVISGFDVSNVANIQPRIYEAFGHIELLPWIGLSYSLSNFATLALARQVLYCFNMRWVYVVSLVVFLAGAAVAGTSKSISVLILGRVIMGIGGSICQQCNTSYFSIFATSTETPRLFGTMSGLWAVGLVAGGPVGSALSERTGATWRWAFYINLPWLGLAVILAVFCLPNYSFSPDLPMWRRLAKIDGLGILLHIAATTLFALAVTFSGSVWEWNSTPSLAIWIAFALAFLLWGLQQIFCIFTTPEQRAFPIHMLSRRDLLPLWVASACAGSSYAITLYYVPLFFAFTRGLDTLEQTVRMTPFILVFIITVMLVGAFLPMIRRYNLIYIVGGVATLAAGATMATTLHSDVAQSQVLGLIAIIGVGLGLHFQHGTAISNVINQDPDDRVESVVIFNQALMGSIAISLAIAGAVFQNVGYSLLLHVLDSDRYTEQDIREALAGVSSIPWQSRDPSVLNRGADAVANAIAREFYIVASSGALCLVCGLLMKQDKLDYGKPKREKDSEA